MAHVVLDAETLKKFGPHLGRVEIRDETGQVIGWFSPRLDQSKYHGLPGPQISPEELERRRKEPGGRSLAEIMVDLEKLA